MANELALIDDFRVLKNVNWIAIKCVRDCVSLTNLGRDKMAVILQTTFSHFFVNENRMLIQISSNFVAWGSIDDSTLVVGMDWHRNATVTRQIKENRAIMQL